MRCLFAKVSQITREKRKLGVGFRSAVSLAGLGIAGGTEIWCVFGRGLNKVGADWTVLCYRAVSVDCRISAGSIVSAFVGAAVVVVGAAAVIDVVVMSPAFFSSLSPPILCQFGIWDDSLSCRGRRRR